MDTSVPSRHDGVSLRRAALVAGLGVLLMALTVPIVEFYIFPKLINLENPAQTTKNIANQTKLFSTAVFIHFLTVIGDVVVAWALYIFFKPANKNLSLLTALFRLVYTAFNIAALLNLIQILGLVGSGANSSFSQSDQLHEYVMLNLISFNLQWRFGLVFFGIYLLLLSYLTFKSSYVPKVIGAFLAVAAIGYLIDDLKYFFYPKVNTGFLWFTFFGELVFMFWLLLIGTRIRIDTEVTSDKKNVLVQQTE
jgi:hypothetical protein